MTASRQALVFLSALLIGFTLLGNEPISNARFESTELILPAIGGVEYRAERFSGVDLGNDSFSWTGKIKSTRGGFVSLAVVNGESAVTVSFADGITYSFRGKLENLVLKPLVSSHQVCGGCVAVADGKLPADPRMGAQPMLSWQNGDANLIDLLVVYPGSVRSDAGGTSAIQAEIVKAVADSNLCYRNSQVNVQLRLVHMEEVSYTPTGMLETDLSRLKATNDGHIDNVHALRDSYGADLVALLTTASNSGGLASTLMHPSLDFESSGFSVNVWTQISAPSYTLAHEIGHNMGCLHNVEDSSGVTALYDFRAFCYGKRWMNSGQGVKTVMSYDTSPSSTYPTTIPYFSNPLVDYQGTLTGNAGSADNAQVLSSTAPYVSNFRTSVVQGILPEVFNLEVVEGNYSNLSVRLSAKPAHAVEVSLSSSGDSDLMLMSEATLNFDSTNWNLPHTVQLYAKPDSDLTSDMGTLILSSNGMPSISVALSEVDNSSNLISGVLLSGVVVNELGVGLGGVSLTLSNGGGQVITDAEGSFLLELSTNWSGAVTPLRDGFSFSPSTLNLGPLSTDSLGHSMVASRSDILYVHGTATGAGDGTSWANAYTDLGDALRATTLFNEVWVAAGSYKAGMVRSSTFLIPPNIAVYGGFSGNEVSRVNRDVLANVTILSGDLGILNNNTDNAFHVVVPSQGSVLDGFTITGGNASENFSDDRGKGAGLWADSASITVSNCKFISNNAYQGGAAIYLKDVNGTFSNCEIISNTTNSTGSGAGLYLEDSNVSFTSSIFSDNQAHYYAGAIRSENSEINLLNCSLSANRSLTSSGGGAMYLNGGSFSIKSTSFTNNQATFQGGAILISGASGSIEDSNFTGNQNTNSNGGGALLIENSSPSILRCRFIENSTSANNNGGAIKLDTSSPIISDSYFVRNQSLVNSAGAVFIDSTSNPIFSNNEFHHNSAAQSAGAVFIQTGSNPIFSDNQFHSNTSSFSGGAFYIDSSSNPIFSDNQFHSNISSQSGGAIFIDSTSNPSFSKNEFRLNSAAQFGGAIFVDGSNLNLNGDLFLGNYANYGGGIAAQGTMSVSLSNVRALGNEANSSSSSSAGFIYLNSDVTSSTFVNSVFSGNKSLGDFGVYRPNGPSRFVNCSIVGNEAGTDGGVTLMFTGDSIELDNCIVWNNTAGTGNDIWVNQGTATANYSLFNPSESIGIISGSNHQSNDPLFTDANGPDNIAGTLDDDLTLQAGSPAVDQGSSSVANYPTADLLGRARAGAPDMGAYEFASNSTPTFTSGNTFSLSENLTVVADLNASDLDGDAIVFSISGGVDQNQFSIEASTGLLSFVTAPDFETPIDNGGDNSYTVEVSVSDGSSTSTLLLTISVVDVSEQGPVQNFTLNLSASSGGSVSGAGSYVSGGNATLLATPEFGYLFSSWSGDLNSTTNPLYLTLDSNLSLLANFTLDSNESLPFDFNASALEVGENSPIDSVVGHMHRTSGEENASVTYTLEYNGSMDAPPFRIESNGTIFTTEILDFETQSQYIVEIVGITENNQTATHFFSVYVLDINESSGGNVDSNESGYGVGPEFTLDTRDPELPGGGGGGNVDSNESGYGVGPEFTLDTRNPELPGGGGGNVDLNESGYGVGPEFTLDTRDPELPGGGGGNVDLNESGYGVGPEFTLDTRDPELPGGGGGNVDLNESGYEVGPEFTLDTRDPELPGGGVGNVDSNESGYGVGPEFTLDTRDPELPGGGGENVDSNESGYGVGPEFTLDTRDPELPGGGGGNVDSNESGYGVGPEFTLDTRDSEQPGVGVGGNVDSNESGYEVGPEFTLDTRNSDYLAPLDFNTTELVVEENAMIGTVIGQILQISGDGNRTVQYSINLDPLVPPPPFRLESNGTLVTTAVLDYEMQSEYSLELRGWTEDESVIHTFHVEIVNLYEAPLDFNTTDLRVEENAAIGTVIGQISQISGDENRTVQYSINLDPIAPPPPFRLESNGTLVTTAVLDYEMQSEYSLKLRGWTEDESVIHTFHVEILDVYEAPLDFNTTDLRVVENAAIGTVIGQIFRTSGDGNGTVQYSINLDPIVPPPPFRLESNGTLVTTAVLDYEMQSEYSLELRGWTEDESVIHTFHVEIVDLHENPIDFNASDLRVEENASIGTFVGQMSQVSGDENTTIEYSLITSAGMPIVPFRLDENGTLFTAGLLDFELISHYLISIEARTNDNEIKVRDFSIIVSKSYEYTPGPIDFNSSVLLVKENRPVGTVVGQMYQISGDENATIEYQLIHDSSLPSPFSLDVNGTLFTTLTLDYEQNSSYLIEVNASNDANENVVHSFTVQVTDVYEEAFDFNASELIISEDAPIGTVIGQMSQVAGEENASVVYHLLHAESQSPSPFILESNGSFVLVHELDYETNSSYPIEVSAWTQSNENAVHSFTVQVEDVYEEAFDFNASELIISEDAPIGTVIGQMSQVAGEENASVVYHLLHGASQSPSPFILESNGSLVLVHELDYEMNNSYPIEVSAWTQSNENAVHSFTVQVEDVYEEPFDFNASELIISEDAPIGTVIGEMSQVAGEENASVVYHLLHGASQSPSPFILESNGSLVLVHELDYETNNSYPIEVSAWTETNENKVHSFTVQVEDVNEEIPFTPLLDPFEFNATALQIPEDAPIGQDVGSVYRVSGDMNQSVHFSLEQNGSFPIPFSVESNGAILVAGTLDYEQNASHVIYIRGTEGNRSAVQAFTIQVVDIFEININSAPHDILILSDQLKVKGNKDAGTKVGSLFALDLDPNDQHTFILVEGNGAIDHSFFVMESNGTLRTSSVLDFGMDQNLSIRVQVSDSKGATYQKIFEVLYIDQEAGEDVILLSEGADIFPGWKRAGWFGFYFADFYPWVYHENLGWIYVSEKTIDGSWFFRERLGWIWTSPEVFPALFQYEQNQWTYLDTSNPMTILFDYDRMEWFQLDREYQVFGLSEPASGGYVKGFGIYQRGQVASIEAVPSSDYIFKGWTGDRAGDDPVLVLEIYSDFKMEALFEPIISADNSPAKAIGNAVEAINSIEGLSPELKQQALAELLLTGDSSTAGIKAVSE